MVSGQYQPRDPRRGVSCAKGLVEAFCRNAGSDGNGFVKVYESYR